MLNCTLLWMFDVLIVLHCIIIIIIMVVPCGTPPTTDNGFFHPFNYAAGSKAVLVCFPGYAVSDVTLRAITCQPASQTWSTPMATCINSPVSSYGKIRAVALAFSFICTCSIHISFICSALFRAGGVPKVHTTTLLLTPLSAVAKCILQCGRVSLLRPLYLGLITET